MTWFNVRRPLWKAEILPFARLFYGTPSTYPWEDEKGNPQKKGKSTKLWRPSGGDFQTMISIAHCEGRGTEPSSQWTPLWCRLCMVIVRRAGTQQPRVVWSFGTLAGREEHGLCCLSHLLSFFDQVSFLSRVSLFHLVQCCSFVPCVTFCLVAFFFVPTPSGWLCWRLKWEVGRWSWRKARAQESPPQQHA